MFIDRFKNSLPLLLSLLIHTTLLAATLYVSTDDKKQQLEQKLTISLSSYTVVEEHDPVKKKEVESKEETEKKVIEKKPPVKETVKKEVVKKKEVVTPKPQIKKEEAPKQKVEKNKPIKKPAKVSKPKMSKKTKKQKTKKKIASMHSKNKSLAVDKHAPPKPHSSSIDPSILGKIRAMIQRSLIYPSMAKRLRLEGVVYITFVLTANGYVKKAQIVQKSGSGLLDRRALETVKDLSGEYPRLSREMQLKIPIVFSLRKL
ncbi:MAG: energy transducer TonB [Sulfurimonas sp.]